jgi:DNA-binding IclR family transcriptional regulator
MHPEQRKTIISQPLTAFTQHTITDPIKLRIDLAEISDQGYAVSNEEFEEGLVAVAAPIHDHTGEVIAALSISGPSFRMRAGSLQAHISNLKECAHLISKELGHIS